MKPAGEMPVSAGDRKEMLDAVLRVYDDWAFRLPLACRRGCSACCTQSVTMTGLEGEMIIDFARGRNLEEWLRRKLDRLTPGKRGNLMTTNQFAAACLNRRDVADEDMEGWDFTPCPFLENGICAVYQVRPFGCRSFGSLARCGVDRPATMAPVHITVNTVFTQIVEHLSSDGGGWSTMADILHTLMGRETAKNKAHVVPARPLPGFLLAPHEVRLVAEVVRPLHEYPVLHDLLLRHIGDAAR